MQNKNKPYATRSTFSSRRPAASSTTSRTTPTTPASKTFTMSSLTRLIGPLYHQNILNTLYFIYFYDLLKDVRHGILSESAKDFQLCASQGRATELLFLRHHVQLRPRPCTFLYYNMIYYYMLNLFEIDS